MFKLDVKKIGLKGSALLTAMLIMGVLSAISLVLSGLIMSETKILKELLDSGRAYYAAESGIEEALYYLNNELPGWQDAKEDVNVSETSGSNFSYDVKNQCNMYPCLDPTEYNHEEIPAYAFYDILELNENVTIPLFVVGEDGNVAPVENFTVEFFVAFDPSRSLKVENVTGWDVLRWKFFSMNKDSGTNNYETDSIGDFTAVSSGQNLNSGEEFLANADMPSWFGTKSCGNVDGQKIKCIDYTINDYYEEGQEICLPTAARDYYIYDASGRADCVNVNGTVECRKEACYPIENFVNSHIEENDSGLNYLSLTNMMNPAMFKDMIDGRDVTIDVKEDLSRIYYRVETYEDNVVREVAEITADGYSGKSKQSLSVQVKRGGYMPVFNFSIFSTYCDPSRESAGACDRYKGKE